MPKSCAALRCGNRYNSKNKELSFHRFPFSKPELLKEWLENVGREDFTPKLHTVICSKHFKPECFSPFGNRKNLKHNAVPTIFNNCLAKAKDPCALPSHHPTLEPNSATVEIVVELEDDSTCSQVPTDKNMEMDTQIIQSTSALRQQISVPAVDHSYVIKDCNLLKKQFFWMLEQNKRLRKQIRMKTKEMRRMSATLWVVKNELRQLKAQVRQGHKNESHSNDAG